MSETMIDSKNRTYSKTLFRPQVSLFKSCKEASEPEDVFLLSILDDIEVGRWEKEVNTAREKDKNLRPGQEKSDYKKFKEEELPAFTTHGTFYYRNDQNIKQRNGLASIDIDHVKDLKTIKSRLTLDPYVYALFESVGGDGVCILSRIDASQPFKDMHSGLREYFLEKYNLNCDDNAKDLSRLRCVSYDPNLYLNEESLIWGNLPLHTTKKPRLLDNDNHRANLLTAICSWMGRGFSNEEIKSKLNGVHISPASCMNGPEAINKLIEDLRSRYFIEAEKNGINTIQYCGFWVNGYKKPDISLSTGLLLEVLIALDFSILDGEYVQVRNGIIYKFTKAELYAFIIGLASFEPVMFKIESLKFTVDTTSLKTKAQKELRGNINLFALPKFNKEIFTDTTAEIFFHFKNKSLKITSAGIYEFDRDNTKCIWEKQLINHELQASDDKSCAFEEFIKNISGENFDAFIIALGYACRTYNGSDGMRALWLCDEDFETGKNNGRSGKGVFCTAISKVRKTDECSGKELQQDNQFKYQNMQSDTQVYVIDDVKKKFDFAEMYNYTTQGVEYSRKHCPRVKLPIQQTPKLIITSNYPPQVEAGVSTTGRLLILPVKPVYTPFTDQGGVKHVHGHVFFDDWDYVEWNRFYWFIAECCESFLVKGLIFSNLTEIRKNRLKSICSAKLDESLVDDFVVWIYDLPLEEFSNFQLTELKEKYRTKQEIQAEIDNQVFASCLKAFFDIECFVVSKERRKKDGTQKTIWEAKKLGK